MNCAAPSRADYPRSVTKTVVPTVDQSHTNLASACAMRRQPCDSGVPSWESASIGEPSGRNGMPWMSIGFPRLETAKRNVHGNVRSPDGELGTFEYTWCSPTDGSPCRPDTRYVCDTTPFASTSQMRCWLFE